ncbi:CKB_collapsed_G0000300.mRNA.1.CDS.1 [Saccharomyces cerevisiae]|nr:MTW1p component of the MIND kinetochore complex [Saccharomyces boulardii (nom. inval.)]CAI5228284.1 CKB_HP2_G0000180.mRNA.1.CDS.1 [Saccharomyces cerevisiae]KQC45724.1 Essential component of the MIND kinetochore complex [Saccharomyces boulardii (nom. inval.)]CAI6378738.1 CKB_HP2_G0000180.mRNA.1.CDS.1 [Saccharomyces cerevisiae]CAI6379026.1 CKB_HP1_G0000300.mRNA.1.CDS.1 [Saccharomyces cerevisiae]
MSAPTMRSTSILTEHLGYPPISLVDDIINAVNEIMYKCTAAMEKYLLSKSKIGEEDYGEEIKSGVAKWESLLENSVDKNFDKLELYVLRNVLRIPEEYLDANVFRLENQKDLVIVDENELKKSEEKLREKLNDVELAFKKNEMLLKRVTKVKRLLFTIRGFKQKLNELLKCKDDVQLQKILESLKPIDDTMTLLTDSLRKLYVDSESTSSTEEVEALLQRLKTNGKQNNKDFRTRYIDIRTNNVLRKLGLLGDKEDEKQSAKPDARTQAGDIVSIDIEEPQLDLLDDVL